MTLRRIALALVLAGCCFGCGGGGGDKDKNKDLDRPKPAAVVR